MQNTFLKSLFLKDACEDRRLQFEHKQGKMREQVLKFEKFIQENDAKRQRAEMKIKQEKQLFNDKVKELQVLADKIQKLEMEQNILINELGNFKIFFNCRKLHFKLLYQERRADISFF